MIDMLQIKHFVRPSTKAQRKTNTKHQNSIGRLIRNCTTLTIETLQRSHCIKKQSYLFDLAGAGAVQDVEKVPEQLLLLEARKRRHNLRAECEFVVNRVHIREIQ